MKLIADTSCFLPPTQLGKENALKLSTVRHFVLDECDKMLEKLGESRLHVSFTMQHKLAAAWQGLQSVQFQGLHPMHAGAPC
jgi:hypothetical protein